MCLEGEEEGEFLDLLLMGEREIDGSEIKPCLIMLETSLEDAIKGRREKA